MNGDGMADEKTVETLRQVLEEIGWDPQPGSRPASFFVDFGEPHVPLSAALAAITEESQFILYIVFGVAAAPDVRDEVAEFVTRANWGLRIGNFELNYADGRVQFKSSVDFTGLELSEILMVNVIRPAISVVESYADALMDVMAQRKSAEQAIADVEGS
jgi:hypothetical protein